MAGERTEGDQKSLRPYWTFMGAENDTSLAGPRGRVVLAAARGRGGGCGALAYSQICGRRRRDLHEGARAGRCCGDSLGWIFDRALQKQHGPPRQVFVTAASDGTGSSVRDEHENRAPRAAARRPARTTGEAWCRCRTRSTIETKTAAFRCWRRLGGHKCSPAAIPDHQAISGRERSRSHNPRLFVKRGIGRFGSWLRSITPLLLLAGVRPGWAGFKRKESDA